MKSIVTILLITVSFTVSAQLTPTQLTQVQAIIRDSMNAQRARTTVLVRDSMNRERAFVRPQISSILTVNNTQNNRLGLQDSRALRDSLAIVGLTAQVLELQQKNEAFAKQLGDLLNFISINTLVPNTQQFTFSDGVLSMLPVTVDLSPITNRLVLLEEWKARLSKINLR